MKLEYIGHAGFILHSNSAVLIEDPWMSATGAFDSSWFQLPCNHHLADHVIDITKDNKTYLYISHEHKDHFDGNFLKRIVEYQPEIILANFHTKVLANSLKQLGFDKIHELTDGSTTNFGPFEVTIFVDDKGINRDSAILTRCENTSFFNMNDCKIYDRLHHIKHTYGEVDILALQFSGAIWHPVCYEMDKLQYQKISNYKKLSKLKSIQRAIRLLNPKRYLPTAGPVAFLDPMLLHINFEEENIFPQQFEAIKHLEQYQLDTKLDAIMPGDVYDFELDKYIKLSTERLTSNNYKQYVTNYAAKYQHLFDEKTRELQPRQVEMIFTQLFDELQKKVVEFNPPGEFEHRLFFGISEYPGNWIVIDLNNKSITTTDELPQNNFYSVQSPAWVFKRLLDKEISWSDWALTMRATLRRKPDIYNSYINIFMILPADELRYYIDLITSIRTNCERITIQANGKNYSVRRYCPHQGAELKYGWQEGDTWVCPRHRWKFNLENGGKCPRSNESIDAKILPDGL